MLRPIHRKFDRFRWIWKNHVVNRLTLLEILGHQKNLVIFLALKTKKEFYKIAEFENARKNLGVDQVRSSEALKQQNSAGIDLTNQLWVRCLQLPK